MRSTAVLAAVVVSGALAASASAQVQLVIKNDGTKMIYNVGSGGGRGSNYTWLAKQRNRRSAYDSFIDRYANEFGVDPVLVRAVIQVESDFNPNCVSNKGARGLMQLMPETARRYGVTKVHDPEDNIRGGVKYLSELLSMFANDVPRALAAYNAGEGAVNRYAGIPPYDETMTYVRRALTVYYGRPYGGGISFAGGFGGKKLAGGFKAGFGNPLAAMLPNVQFLGTR